PSVGGGSVATLSAWRPKLPLRSVMYSIVLPNIYHAFTACVKGRWWSASPRYSVTARYILTGGADASTL
ncbi:MAG TPA: hypothetical protein VID72_07450, partial [Ktedonobacterales bacterium]